LFDAGVGLDVVRDPEVVDGAEDFGGCVNPVPVAIDPFSERLDGVLEGEVTGLFTGGDVCGDGVGRFGGKLALGF
jgi:hypothetical protein